MQIISQSGWTGLYRGLKPSLLGTTISQGVYFYLYSILRQAAVKLEQRRGRGLNGEQLTFSQMPFPAPEPVGVPPSYLGPPSHLHHTCVVLLPESHIRSMPFVHNDRTCMESCPRSSSLQIALQMHKNLG